MRWRWLVLLPVAVLLVLATSASRLQLYWWPGELRAETSGRQGEPVDMVDRWVDEKGSEHERRFAVTLVDVRPATWVEGYSGPEPVEPPAGVAVWRISLEFEVDPEVPLGGCKVSLVDTDGREAVAVGGDVGDVLLPSTSCEPGNRKGPDYDGARDEEVLPRLPTYRVAVFAVAAADAVPAAVRLWWEPTDYVEIDVIGR
ncbi:hypothetical protein [Nocardioides dilutus]